MIARVLDALLCRKSLELATGVVAPAILAFFWCSGGLHKLGGLTKRSTTRV